MQVRIEVSAQNVVRYLEQAEDALHRTRTPMWKCGRIIIEDIQEESKQGISGDGQAFPPYDEGYEAFKSQYYPGRRRLELSGEGLEERSFEKRIAGKQMTVSYRGPQYMKKEQQEKYKWWGIREQSFDKVVTVWEDWIRTEFLPE